MAIRNLAHPLVMGVHHDRIPGGFQSRHHCDEEIAAEPLRDVLEQQAAERAAAATFVVHATSSAATGVEEGEAHRPILFVLDQLCLRIGELAAGGQRHLEEAALVAVLERDAFAGELHAGVTNRLYRLERRQGPELYVLGTVVAPGIAAGGDHFVAGLLIAGDLAVGADTALVLKCQFTGLAGLAGVLRQLAEGGDAGEVIRLVLRFAGAIEAAPLLELGIAPTIWAAPGSRFRLDPQ